MNSLLMIGVNHHSTPLEIRERLAWWDERLPGVLDGLLEQVAMASHAACGCDAPASRPEAVILSTCNRTELYLTVPDVCLGQQAALNFLASQAGLDASLLEPLTYHAYGLEAVQHLCTVAAGLDSLVKGEHEILGQVKHALQVAQACQSSGPLLSALFRYAVQAGKRVRTETEIGALGRSVACVVVELAQEMFGSLEARTALLVGAGKFSAITARALVSAGLRCVLIANRTYDRAVSLAQSLGAARASTVHFDALPASLTEADIVICSTGAPHVVLHMEQVAQAMQARPLHPLLVADLAVPRDADPAIAALPNVSLTHLDGLERLAQERYPVAAATLDAAGKIIDQVAGEYWAWYETRRSAPLIQALRHKADVICAAEVRHALRRLEGLTPTQQQAVEAMAQAIVNKLLHDPISALKEAGGSHNEDFLAWIEDLYGLDQSELVLHGLHTPEAN